MRPGIPINLPDAQKKEALSLRNQLLMYRFTVRNTIKLDDTLYDASLSPRLNQIVIPLLSIIDDEHLRDEVRSAVRGHDERLYAERASSMEAGILEVLAHMLSQDTHTVLALSEITDGFRNRYSTEYERPITNRVVGSVIRKRLRLITYKRNGVYVVPPSETPKIHELCHRYGVTEAQHS